MATEEQYVDGDFSNLASTRGKRKRTTADGQVPARQAPMTRRGNNQYIPAQQGDANGVAPTASMNDNSGDFLQGSGDFNLQHLHSNANNQAQEQDESSNVNTAAAALNYSLQVPPQNNPYIEPPERENREEGPYDNAAADDSTYQPPAGDSEALDDDDGNDGPSAPGKPALGSDEWVRLRKNNHKEVERRRRETINEGINELAKIVPNCDKNKGAILSRAVQHITKLQDELSQNVDKWTFEKLVTEQAINDLSGKLRRSWEEKEAWKRIAKEAGVDVDNVDLGLEEEEPEVDEPKARPTTEKVS